MSITDTVKENEAKVDKKKVDEILKEFSMDQGTLDCFVKKKKGSVVKGKPTPIKKVQKIPTPKKSEESQWCLEHLENSEEKKPLSPEM